MSMEQGKATDWLDADTLRELLARGEPARAEVDKVIAKALQLKGLELEDMALLLNTRDPDIRQQVLQAAGRIKEAIYGRRMVLFAPLYFSNRCMNDCLYCAFRAPNTALHRRSLSLDEIKAETRVLLREGHKRILLLCGESAEATPDLVVAMIEAIYSVREPAPGTGKEASIRRINVEVAPLDVEGFRKLKSARIGTYACFQETYDPELYRAYHRAGPKADYRWRLEVMDRAMEAGIEDVGIGALFGLGDWRFEVLGLLRHAQHLEERFGCGPHTVSVPRIEPAEGAPASSTVPAPVSDEDFKYLVALLRIAMPYTGIILSTRESETLRDELFRYGVSQISAGSRTNPGAYADAEAGRQAGSSAGSQFQLGDHRTLQEVVAALARQGYVPSFCTGCYRKGRVGADFMDLAKPGLIKRFCEPNALFTFFEYLEDFADEGLKAEGLRAIEQIIGQLPDTATREKTRKGLEEIAAGARDVYL